MIMMERKRPNKMKQKDKVFEKQIRVDRQWKL